MAWIGQKSDDDPAFKSYRGPHGVDNIVKVHGLFPEALDAHMRLYRTLLFGEGGLTRAQREMIGVVVSDANRCKY